MRHFDAKFRKLARARYRSNVALRVSIDALADSIPTLRASRVVAIVCDSVEFGEPGDTEPAPPPTEPCPQPAVTLLPPPPDFDAEPTSELVARAYGWR